MTETRLPIEQELLNQQRRLDQLAQEFSAMSLELYQIKQSLADREAEKMPTMYRPRKWWQFYKKVSK